MARSRFALLLGVALLLASPAARAGSPVSEAAPAAAPAGAAVGRAAPDMGAAALRVGLALALVIGGVQGLRFAMTRWGARIPGLDPRMQAIRVLSTRYIGPRKSLALVEVEGRRILLGLGAAEIRSLAVFDDAVDLRRERTGRQEDEDRYDA